MTTQTDSPTSPVGTEVTIKDWSALTSFEATHEEISVIKKSICRDLNNAEFLYFLNYCAAVKLHPLLKQVWVFRKKDWTDRSGQLHRGELVMFTGRDGFAFNAERHPDYRGYKSAAVYENDYFEVDWNDQKDPIKHSAKGFERGALIGAYAVCFREKCPPAVAITKLGDFSKRKKARNAEQEQKQIEQAEAKGKQSAWDTNEMDMIIIRAEAKAFSKQFPISGIQSQHDWKQNTDGTVSPINQNDIIDHEETQEELLLVATEELFEVWEESKHKDKNFFKQRILDQQAKGELTFDEIKKWKEMLADGED